MDGGAFILAKTIRVSLANLRQFGCAPDLRDHGKAALEGNHAAGDAGELGFRRVARCWQRGMDARLVACKARAGAGAFRSARVFREGSAPPRARGRGASPALLPGHQRGADTYPRHHRVSRGAEALLRGELAVQTDRTGTGREAAGDARVLEFARCAPGKWA